MRLSLLLVVIAAFMLIEGTGFALALAVYLYLMSLAATWPIDAPKPDPLPGTLVTVILLASVIANILVSRWAQRQELRKVRIGMVVMSILGIAPLPQSLDEALNVMQDSELMAETLGEHVFDFFLRNKREEWRDYRHQVTAFELDRYLPVL